MSIHRTFAIATVVGLLAAGGAAAAPCAVGTTTDSTGKTNAKDTSSNVDGGATAKVSPGAKAESPGTVGAMNNVGANTRPAPNEAKPAEGKVVKPGDTDC